LRRVWWFACKEENINPRAPTRLPLLFALDAKLRIANGFVYAADCRLMLAAGAAAANGNVHCGTSFADGSFSGDADSMGGVDSSDGSGDSGDGGGGCGGD